MSFRIFSCLTSSRLVRLSLLAAFGFGANLATEQAKAVNISWGTSLLEDFVDSDGNDLDSSVPHGGFDAYLGYFSTITPDSSNLSSWLGDFVVFDSTSVNLGPGATDGFTSSANLDDNQMSNGQGALPASTFPQGTQAYVWMRNQTNVDSDMEWTLYTDSSWVFPDGTDTHSPGDVEWFLSEPPNTDVFGMTNYDGTTYDSPTDPEERTDPGTEFGIQTGTIPEPSTSLLALLGIVGLLIRRDRRS